MRSPNVVILGCGRSGTSIFGELFEALPNYRYMFEPKLSDLAAVDFSLGPVAAKVPRHPDENMRFAGLPFVLSQLLSIVPEPRRFFWIVRHPLDCISSLRPGISENWSHSPRPSNWEALTHEPLVVRCASHWANINTSGFAQVADFADVIKYEDIVRNPADSALELLHNLGLWDDLASRHAASSWARRVNDNPGSNEAARQTYWLTRDHSTHIGRWRENLTSDDVEAARQIIEAPARRFGYSLPPSNDEAVLYGR